MTHDSSLDAVLGEAQSKVRALAHDLTSNLLVSWPGWATEVAKEAIVNDDRRFHGLTEVERRGISPSIKEAVLRGVSLVERGVETSVAKPSVLVGGNHFAQTILRDALAKPNGEVQSELSKFGFTGQWFIDPNNLGPGTLKDCDDLRVALIEVERANTKIKEAESQDSKRNVADQLDF
jgi:hypothetical protein